MENQEEAKLQRFLQWLQANRVDLRGCKIKYCGPTKGFGLFYSENHNEGNCDCKFSGILLVVPLDLAITPMRVLQDPSLGPKCRALFEEGEVDDRFLMILFLTLERLRKNSAWKPYLDMLPSTFGNPLWFTDDEFLELKGTTLYRATELQKKNLQSLYEDKVKDLATKLLDGEFEREMQFEDFLWANSIFWTRALNIPFPHSYVFPQMPEEQESCCSTLGRDSGAPSSLNSSGVLSSVKDKEGIQECEVGNGTEPTSSTQGETIWVEGLVPAIDFCNHGLKAAATWEVDGFGVTTGVPASMYLLSAEQSPFQLEKEILISYGNKGNEELLYLYGFVIDNNPDDYLMVHYPVEAIQTIPFADSKLQLLEVQKAEMRCLLPRSLLDNGFFPLSTQLNEYKTKLNNGQGCNYSWCGQRKMPSYLNKLVFPEDFLTALRTIAMKEEELFKVSSLLEELVGSEEERQPSNAEVRAAVWEACGDSGALQLLVDLLQTKMMELEEGTGTETSDSELLEKAQIANITEGCMRQQTEEMGAEKFMSRNRWSSIIYRRGQKRLTRLFLKEAEQALHLCLSEQSRESAT